MSATLSQTIDSYIDAGHGGRMCSIGNDFAVLVNPSFDVLPNHPYRSPLVVAVYCKRGHGKGRINARTFDISEHSYFVVLPSQITELIDVSDDFEATYVIMSEEFVSSISFGNTFSLRKTVAEHPHVVLGERAREAFEGYVSMCANLIPVESNPHRLEILRLLTHAFFLGLGYFIHETPSADTNTRSSNITNEFIRLVESDYREHRDLAYYAEQMGLTAKYLSTVVKQSSGKSAVEWIEKYVTLDATTQLTSTSRTIKEIAYDLNFPSQSFFGKYFCRVVGVSPAKYRSEHKSH